MYNIQHYSALYDNAADPVISIVIN